MAAASDGQSGPRGFGWRPGDLARELGIPRSTLTYHLEKFVRNAGKPCHALGYNTNSNMMQRRLAGKRLERVGGGQNVRYRIVPETPPET